MTRLTPESLGTLGDRVRVPGYDRAACSAGIVHLGVGGFHRAHEAVYVDDLLAGGHREWAICGVGLLDRDRGVADALRAQSGLYTLVTESPDGATDARVIGSLRGYRFAPEDPEDLLETLAAPTVHIVSLTITEGGYGVDDLSGAFRPQDAATLRDLESDGLPSSAIGYLSAALARRRERGLAPFTVMSCDNLPGNGDVARTAVLGFARARDRALARWIEERGAFPNAMVDRITPATTDETRAFVATRLGIDDSWPVRSESFRQWVLEDRFADGRPPFGEAGVQLVTDVGPYERMKLRLLNASHQVMSYVGILAGEEWVDAVCRDPLFAAYLRGYLQEEGIPTLDAVPGIDLSGYCEDLMARFGSRAIRDTLARQVVDASDRIPKFLLPVLRHQLAAGGRIDHCVLTLAGWSVFLERGLEPQASVPIVDRRAEDLFRRVAAERTRPGSFLDDPEVFGDLGAYPRLRREFVAARNALRSRGVRETISELLASASE